METAAEGFGYFFQQGFLARVAADSFNRREPEFRFEPNTTDTTIDMLFRALYAEVKEGCPKGALFGESLGTTLAMALIRRFAVTRVVAPTYTKDLNARALNRVIDYIDSNLGENLSIVLAPG